MLIKRKGHYVYRNAAGEGGENGGADGGESTGAAGAGTDAGAAGNDDNAGAGDKGRGVEGSLLASGAKPGSDSGTEFIPEKYRVTKEDGTLDLEASSRKLAEAHASAEKRIGSGDLPPKTAEEYAVEIPEAFKEVFNPAEDTLFQEFRTKAHEAGLTQKQMDLVMGQYFQLAPQLVAGAQIMDAQAATEDLKKEWATQATFDRNIKHAFAATDALAKKVGLDIDAIMQSPLGNDPKFLRLMAAIGPELAEDNSPGGDVMGAGENVNDLINSEAYTNPKHKDHAKVSAAVKAYFEKKHGTEAAA